MNCLIYKTLENGEKKKAIEYKEMWLNVWFYSNVNALMYKIKKQPGAVTDSFGHFCQKNDFKD